MNNVEYRVLLDMHNKGSQTLLQFNRGDSLRTIIFVLTEDGKPYRVTKDCSCLLSAVKPDGTELVSSCTINNDGTITYYLSGNATAAVGTFDCQLTVTNAAGAVSAPVFSVCVREAVIHDIDLESTSEFDALVEAYNGCNDLTKRVQDLENVAGTMNTVFSAFRAGTLKGDRGEKGERGDTGLTGATGATGTGIANIVKTATEGKTDTYTVTLTDGQTKTFTVTNGSDGATGEKGEKGDPFAVFKTYPSVGQMNADAENVPYGKMVMISSSVEDEDNAKLYVRNDYGFGFVTDLSGAAGIKGEKGNKGDKGEKGEKGDPGAGAESITAESIGALGKVTSAGDRRVYAVTPEGGQTTLPASGSGTGGNTVLCREADGSCRMQDPTDDLGIANRRTVDAAKADAVVFTNTSGNGGEGSAEVATVRGDRTYLIRFDASTYTGNNLVTYVLHNGQMVANTAPYDYGGNLNYAGVRNNADGTVTVTGYVSPGSYESVVCSVIPVRHFSRQTVTCFIEGTPVLLRNKDTGEITEKNIEDVQAGDYLAFWSPAKGRLTQTRAVVPPVVGECDKYHRLSFSDGKTVDVFGNQFFWEIDRDQLINWTRLVPGESRVCTATGDIVTYTGSEEIVPAAPVRHYTLMTFKGRYLAGGIQVGDKVELFYPRLTAPEYAEYWNGLTEGDRNYFKRAWAEGMHRRNWRFSREYEEATRELRKERALLDTMLAERQQYLDSTDYQTAKLAEGLLTEEEYADTRVARQAARDAVNNLRERLRGLAEELEAAEQAVRASVQKTLIKKYENTFAGKTRAEIS